MSNIQSIRPPADKNALRKQCRLRRAAIPALTRIDHAAQVAQLFAEHIDIEGMIIAGYSPIGEELDIAPLLHALHESGVECCLPVTSPPSKLLTFRRWEGDLELTLSHHGISVPPATSPAVTPDIVIVPLVGFNATLHRIGYGAGYYDATLRALRRRKNPPLVVGVAFEAQRADHFLPDAHDEPLDILITETGIRRKPE